MAENTKCPNCECEFSIKQNLKYRLRATSSFFSLALDNMVFPWRKGFEEVYRSHLVICPNCETEFSVSEYRYFGILKAKHLQIGLILFFLILIFAPVAIMFWNITR